MSEKPCCDSAVHAAGADSSRPERFVHALSSNARRIYGYILTLLPNRSDAEEVFQEVTLLLWQRYHEFEPGTNFGAWACRIAYFKTLQFLDRSRRRPIAFSSELIESLDQEMADMDSSVDAEYQALAACLARLSPGDREMITLRYREGGTVKQVSEELGRPLKSVYRSLDRIRFALLDCIVRKMSAQDSLS